MRERRFFQIIERSRSVRDTLFLMPTIAAIGYVMAEVGQRGSGPVGGFIGTYVGETLMRLSPSLRQAMLSDAPMGMIPSDDRGRRAL